MKSGIRRTINWTKYQEIISTVRPNEYLDHLVNRSFQRANKIFASSFESNAHGTRHTGYFLSKVERKNYNVMIDGQNFFKKPLKIDLRTYVNVRKITTGQGDDYTTVCLNKQVNHPYFKENYNLIAIDLNKQQELQDPKAIQ